MKIMKIWFYKLFLTVFFIILQVKCEMISLDSKHVCQTNVRRQTMRKYPPGTALYFDGKCVCGRLLETINGYNMPRLRLDNKIIMDYSKTKMTEIPTDNRIIGNYGSLVFSANVRTLNSLKSKHEDQYLCCNCVKSSPSSNRIHSNRTGNKLLPNEIVSKVHEEFSNQAANKAECTKFSLISINVSTEIDIEISIIN